MDHFQNKTALPHNWQFSVGDYVKVGLIESALTAKKKKIQFFEGIVIGIRNWVTIRRPGSNRGIERILASDSPQIQSLQILESQKFRRSKLFYLRKRIGKAAFG